MHMNCFVDNALNVGKATISSGQPPHPSRLACFRSASPKMAPAQPASHIHVVDPHPLFPLDTATDEAWLLPPRFLSLGKPTQEHIDKQKDGDLPPSPPGEEVCDNTNRRASGRKSVQNDLHRTGTACEAFPWREHCPGFDDARPRTLWSSSPRTMSGGPNDRASA